MASTSTGILDRFKASLRARDKATRVAAKAASKPRPATPSSSPARKSATLPACDFSHLRPATPLPAARAQPETARDFAMKMCDVAARVRGERFDRKSFVDRPEQPPDRHVTAAEIIAAARKGCPHVLAVSKSGGHR